MSYSADFQAVAQRFPDRPGLPFTDDLTPDRIREILEEPKENYRDRIYPRWVTLNASASGLRADGSSQETVIVRHQACRLARGISQRRLRQSLTDWFPCLPGPDHSTIGIGCAWRVVEEQITRNLLTENSAGRLLG